MPFIFLNNQIHKQLKKASTIIVVFFLSCLLYASDSTSQNISQQQYLQIDSLYGPKASSRVKAWLALLKSAKNLDEHEKLNKVNKFFNQLDFVSDLEHWKKQDYWATPLEMLVTNGGDCEDFSVAKYFSLRQLNVPMKKLRLTYVKALELNQAHMVLSYFADGSDEPLILDNLIEQIKTASERKDLRPIYSFNGEDLWLSKERARGQWIGKSSKISLWGDLLERFTQNIEQQIAIKKGQNKNNKVPKNDSKKSVFRRSNP